MAAYLIAHLTIEDVQRFARYREAVPDVIEAFEGTYLVRGGKVEVREGEWPGERMVVVRFPSMAAARRFYESEEYQAILPLRIAAARGALAIVAGVDEG